MLHVRKILWFCQQGEGFCMHVFSSNDDNYSEDDDLSVVCHVENTRFKAQCAKYK